MRRIRVKLKFKQIAWLHGNLTSPMHNHLKINKVITRIIACYQRRVRSKISDTHAHAEAGMKLVFSKPAIQSYGGIEYEIARYEASVRSFSS